MIESDYLTKTSWVKVVVFMEPQPLTDKFEQIMLTEEQHKRFLDFMAELISGKKEGSFNVECNDKHKYSFPEIKTWFTQEEFKDPLV